MGVFDNRKLRLEFDGADLVERTFSQAGQDVFVLSMLDGKREGVFLDLGCHHPIVINNTYLLESQFGWNGLSIDIDEGLLGLFVFRHSTVLNADCTKLDWDAVLQTLGTDHVDYLSLDLEPPAVTLECLQSIPFERVKFSVVTFEHDAYRAGDEVRQPSREIFEKNGYVRVCSNVRLDGLQFEDWYFHPEFVDPARAAILTNEDQDWTNMIFK